MKVMDMVAVGRREFLAGTVSVAALGALSACGSSVKSTGSGNFTAMYDSAGSSETLDPGTATMFIDEARIKHIYDGLFELDSQMRAVPRLVTDFRVDADGARWQLRLRDARWHDGAPLTADDVLFTLARILGRQTQKQPFVAATTLSAIDLRQSRAIDPRTVELTLTQPSFDLPNQLTAYGTRIIKNGTRNINEPNGTGAFKFQSFTAGKEFTATAFNDHWGGAPHVQRLRILSAAPEARLAAVRAGQADFVDAITPAAQRTLASATDVTAHATPNSGILYFAMKTGRAPFNNPDVRRAMMLMIDREELVKVALQGSGEVSDDIFGRGYEYYPQGIAPHRHDPERAKSLLRSAGAADLSFELFVAPVANGFIEAAKLLADQARAIGVTVRVVIGAKDTYYTEYLTRGDMVMGQSGPLAIPYHFASRLLSTAPKNVTQWRDPQFDEQYAIAQREPSHERRAAIYRQMHETLHDRGGYIFWATTPWLTAYRNTVTNAPAGVPNAIDWARFDEVKK